MPLREKRERDTEITDQSKKQIVKNKEESLNFRRLGYHKMFAFDRQRWRRGHSVQISSCVRFFFDRTKFKRNHTLQMVVPWEYYSFCRTEELDLSERGATLALINDFNLAQQNSLNKYETISVQPSKPLILLMYIHNV